MKRNFLPISLLCLFVACALTGCWLLSTTSARFSDFQIAGSEETGVPLPPCLADAIEVPETDMRMFEHALSPNGETIAGIVDIGPQPGCPYLDCVNYALYTFDVTTGETSQLTELPIQPRNPFWSPSGEMIGFWVSGFPREGIREGIWIMNADGTEKRYFATGSNGAWSPDGQNIATVQSGNSSFVLRVFDVTTGEGNIVHRQDGYWDWDQFAWSPDGRRIALTWRESTNSPASPARLYVLDLSTLEMTALSEDSRAIVILDWTDNGEWLAYVSSNGNFFARWDGACRVTPPEIADLGWAGFSGQTSRFIASHSGTRYILDLSEVLGPNFPEEVLSCP